MFINGSGFQLRRAAALEYVCPLRFKAPPSNPHPALQLAPISQIWILYMYEFIKSIFNYTTQIFPWKIKTPFPATHPSSWLRFSELWILSLAQDSHFRQGRGRQREEEQRKETWYSPTAKDRLTSDNFKVQSFSIMCIFAFRPPWDYTNSST